MKVFLQSILICICLFLKTSTKCSIFFQPVLFHSAAEFSYVDQSFPSDTVYIAFLFIGFHHKKQSSVRNVRVEGWFKASTYPHLKLNSWRAVKWLFDVCFLTRLHGFHHAKSLFYLHPSVFGLTIFYKCLLLGTTVNKLLTNCTVTS